MYENYVVKVYPSHKSRCWVLTWYLLDTNLENNLLVRSIWNVSGILSEKYQIVAKKYLVGTSYIVFKYIRTLAIGCLQAQASLARDL